VNNPCLLAEALGLRAGLLRAFADDDPRIENDLAEQRVLCERHGAQGWLAAD
jgi:hypothetical protein